MARRVRAKFHKAANPSPFKGFNNSVGPRIEHDATFTIQFVFSDNSLSCPLELTCAVIPDGAMPGDVTLGLSMHAKLATQYLFKAVEYLHGSIENSRNQIFFFFSSTF